LTSTAGLGINARNETQRLIPGTNFLRNERYFFKWTFECCIDFARKLGDLAAFALVPASSTWEANTRGGHEADRLRAH
jgi:hypothetical protein